METVLINTDHQGGPPPDRPLKLKKYKPVLIYSANEVWPRQDSPVTTEVAFTGSWQEDVQLPPHVRLRSRWLLRADAPGTVFNSEGFACDYQLAQADWFPGSFDMRVRALSSREQATLQQSAVNNKEKAWIAVDLRRRPGMRYGQYLKGVNWPCPNMRPDLVHVFKNWFRPKLMEQDMTLLVHAANAHAIIS